MDNKILPPPGFIRHEEHFYLTKAHSNLLTLILPSVPQYTISHEVDEKVCMHRIDSLAMGLAIMALGATNEVVACIQPKARPYLNIYACATHRPNKPGQREYILTKNYLCLVLL